MTVTSEPTQEILVFRDRSSATIVVSDLGSNRFRIDDPLIAVTCSALRYHDVIKTKQDADGRLVIQRRVEKGGFHTYDYILSEGWRDRQAVQRVLVKVRQLGGKWEGVFGGVLIVCLPPTTDYDPSEDIAEAMK